MSSAREFAAFLILSPTEQLQAIVRLSRSGMSEHSIAAATRLNVEQIRQMLAGAEPSKCARTGVPMRFCTCAGPHDVEGAP